MLGLEVSNEKSIWRYEIEARGGTDKTYNLTAVVDVEIIDGFLQRLVRFVRGVPEGKITMREVQWILNTIITTMSERHGLPPKRCWDR